MYKPRKLRVKFSHKSESVLANIETSFKNEGKIGTTIVSRPNNYWIKATRTLLRELLRRPRERPRRRSPVGPLDLRAALVPPPVPPW